MSNNDTNTLNGALSELGETMAGNLVSMGVTGATASDGLTTLAGKILDIAPSVGGITPTVSITITTTPSLIYEGNNVILSATVNADYDDTSQTNVDLKGYLQGATITWKEGNTTLGTSVSDTNGVATYTITGISGTHTYTAIFDGTGTDYESATGTITVTPLSYLINDDASVDNSSTLFASSIALRNSGTATATYVSGTPCYQLKNTKSSSESFIEYPALQGIYNQSFKVTTVSKCTTTSVAPICLYYYLDSNNWGGVKDEGQNMWYGKKVSGSYTEQSYTKTNNKTAIATDIFTFDATNNTLTVERYVNDTKTADLTWTIAHTLTSSVKWGTTLAWDNNVIRELYSIQAEYI